MFVACTWETGCMVWSFYAMETKSRRKPDKSSSEVLKNKRELDRSKKRDQPIRKVLQVFRHPSTWREWDRFCLGWRVRRSYRMHFRQYNSRMWCSSHREEFFVLQWWDLEPEETLMTHWGLWMFEIKQTSLSNDRILHSGSLDKHLSRVNAHLVFG